MGQRMGRRIVRGEPDVVFTASETCVVRLVVPSRSLDDETDNPIVVVQVGTAPAVPYGDEDSVALPFNYPFEVFLEAGEDLWAVSPGESMLVYSAIPR